MHRLRFLRSRGIHLVLTVFWMVMIVPTLVWWKNSILWVALMSAYALIVSHWSAYQGARAEHQAARTDPPSLQEAQDGPEGSS